MSPARTSPSAFSLRTLRVLCISNPFFARSGLLALTLATATHGQPTYNGRTPDAAWRAPALARIDQNRKGDFTLRVTDAAGQPVVGATVTVVQQRHAFPFGTALQMARLVQDSPTNRLYRQKSVALFNAASTENDLKWPVWIGEWGAGYTKAQTLAGLGWLRDRGFGLRGHVFVWPSWSTSNPGNLPTSLTALRGTARQNEVPQLVLDHIAEQAAATRDLINEWDVQNEPNTNHDLMDLFGPQIQADWFHAARAALPTAALYLNDYNIEDQGRFAAQVRLFEDTARYLLQRGAPLTGLGLQGHINGIYPGIPDYLATLDRYAAFGLPIRITEFDVNTTDDSLQADYTRDFLTASFSHASMAGFQLWGFWQGAHWRPNSALYRTDWSEKPNGAVYRDLVFNQWWTRAAGATDAQGTYRGRGFHGDFLATVTVNGQRIEKTFSLAAPAFGAPAAPGPVIQITATPPRLANLSTRASVGGAAGSPIAGFVIEGSTPKLVLLRAAGPALAAFGLPTALARPALTLFRGDQAVAANTGWASAANSAEIAAAAGQVGAFAFAANAADSALLLRLDPGAYTARISSADATTGIALVEAYEIEPDATRFINLSTRAFVGPGDAAAIPGLVVTGASARTYLIRAVGPGLAEFGVTGALARPSLVLLNGNAPIAANDGWETAADPALLAATAQRVGAFALRPGNADAALLITLERGVYTALVTSASGGNASGQCLIEIYEVK